MARTTPRDELPLGSSYPVNEQESVRSRRGSQASAVHVVVFDADKKPREVRIYPIAPPADPGTQRGRPLLAKPGTPAYTAVLKRAIEACKAYGTAVEAADDHGVVRVP